MKKKIFKIQNNKQKLLYYILIGLAVISIIIGILFIFIIDKDSTLYITKSIKSYYESKLDGIKPFFKILFNNYIYLIIIWILGISLIGLPIVLLMFIFKAFIYGFSISSIFYSFGSKGIIITMIDILLNKGLYIIILILLTRYSVSFSIKLFKYLFLKVPINFKVSMHKYIKILFISLLVTLFISVYEGFIANYLLNFFNI
jgi:stage II sporulation protein M